MRNEMGSSSRNPEGRDKGQSGSSSNPLDFFKLMSNLGKSKEAQGEDCSNEQQDRKQVQQEGKEGEKKMTFQDLHPDLQQGILAEHLAEYLAKNLRSVGDYRNYHDRNAAIDLIVEAADKSLAPEVVQQLTGCSSDFKLEILSVIKRWGNQSAVPELVEMLKDHHSEKYSEKDFEMYGAIAGVIGKLGGLSKVKELLDNDVFFHMPYGFLQVYAMERVKRMLESSSAGQELVKELHTDHNYRENYLTTGVLRMLGDMSIAKKIFEIYPYYKGYNAIGEICKRSDDPKEIKVLADKSVNLIREGGVHWENGVQWETQRTMFRVIGGLGKRLVQLKAVTEAKMLSKTLVAMFFNERVGTGTISELETSRVVVPDHFNAVFMIEQHLAEQGPMMRLLYPDAVDKKVCEAIAKEVVDYRKGLVGLEDVEKFYGKLFEIFSHSEIEEKVRFKMIFSIADRIGEVENKPFMPELLKRLSPALLRGDWSSKAYEIYKLSKNSSAKDIGELFEELIGKIPDEQISPDVQKAIVRLTGVLGRRPSLALKLTEKLSDERFDSNVHQEIVDAWRKLGRKLVNQGEDIKELTEKLCDRLPRGA